MTKWEYSTLTQERNGDLHLERPGGIKPTLAPTHSLAGLLNELGEQGFDLVASVVDVDHHLLFVFKRPKPEGDPIIA